MPYPIHAKGLKEYVLITMGYHVGASINLIIEERRNDFFEMLLHHIVANYLFGGLYLFNIWGGGSVFAFLHDIADITTNLIKPLSESKDKVFSGPTFIFHMSVWFYTRLLVLPYLIYLVWILRIEIKVADPIIIPVFCWLLCCMWALHTYWFYMFCQMLQKYVKTGVKEDE
jgi:acyl-CoA-dependent ceramide synthase